MAKDRADYGVLQSMGCKESDIEQLDNKQLYGFPNMSSYNPNSDSSTNLLLLSCPSPSNTTGQAFTGLGLCMSAEMMPVNSQSLSTKVKSRGSHEESLLESIEKTSPEAFINAGRKAFSFLLDQGCQEPPLLLQRR